jgi:hypothetical protein
MSNDQSREEFPGMSAAEFQRRSIKNDWKSGNEFAPYHPSASHIRPDYRDGWNRCYAAAQARIAELEAQLSSAREVAMEEALRVCEAEALEDPQVGTEDIAYDLAVSHCAEAIRQLATKADKRPAAKEE